MDLLADGLRVTFWLGFLGLAAVWLLYPAFLELASSVSRSPPLPAEEGPAREVVVLLAAHNEAGSIVERLDNVFAVGSRKHRLSVVVASDHSTDDTMEKVAAYSARHPGRPVTAFATSQRGKAMAHNEAMERIRSDLVIFTDADTIFAGGFTDHLVAVFDDPRVGFASGALSWRRKSTDCSETSVGLYWAFEEWLRYRESKLGILVVGSGACSAVLRELWKPLSPTSDEDCSTPLDVVQQGYLCRHVPEANAIDFVKETRVGEFRSRIRMTAKNFRNTLDSWAWRRNTLLLPWHTAGLVLHKIGRWLTPFFALSFLAGGIGLVTTQAASTIEMALTALALTGVLAALIGVVRPHTWVLGSLGDFAIVNTAFAIGTINALSGRVPDHFDKTT